MNLRTFLPVFLRNDRSVRSLLLIVALVCGITSGVSGCKDLTGSPGLPAGTPAPSFYSTPAGAIGMRNAAIYEFQLALPQYITDAGLLTDELEDVNTGASQGVLLSTTGVVNALDERILPEVKSSSSGVASYDQLQQVREFAGQAISALATYDTIPADTATSKIFRGELYALEAYAEVMLADFFCSGVPLSTLDFEHDFTYHPSATTQQVYQDAAAKFDSALALADTSTQVRYLAQVGRGRVYLALNQYTAAADDVTTVPTNFQYQLAATWSITASDPGFCFPCNATVSNREGINGLPYRSNGDPRTATLGVAVSQTSGDSLYFPVKYSAGLNGSGFAPFTVASGVEARLIEAEAALRAAPGATTWLTTLNTLRATVNLGPLSDPIDPTARVDTLFTERAAWLFLDGHRQADLRRLLRQYSQYAAFRSQAQVYPTGQYFAPGTGRYGTDVTAPIPPDEFANPLFHGCLDRKP